MLFRGSHRRCSVMVFLKISLNFAGKHLCWSLFNKVTHLRAFNFIKETPTQVFSCEICDIFMNTYYEKHLRTTASCYSEVFQTIAALQSSEISRKHPHSSFSTAIFLVISINTFRNGCRQFHGKLVNLVSHMAKSYSKK